jgi:hypothetical protein
MALDLVRWELELLASSTLRVTCNWPGAPYDSRVDKRRIQLACGELANLDERYRRAHAVRTEGLGSPSERAQAEKDFAQAHDKLLRMMVNTVLVIGEELTGEELIYEERYL